MTESEAIEKLEWYSSTNGCGKCTNAEHNAAKLIAVAALEEIQQYRAIGTLEECREAVEKMKPKKVQKIQIPNTSWTKAQTRFECPSCHKYLNYRELSHCGLCGQRLLWEE